MFGLDPLTSTIIIGGGIFIMGVILGRSFLKPEVNEIIESTITNLAREGYIKYYIKDGEMYLEKLDGSDNDQTEEIT